MVGKPLSRPTVWLAAQLDNLLCAVLDFLALLFLGRYVRYCARRRRYAQMEGAARLARSNWAPQLKPGPPSQRFAVFLPANQTRTIGRGSPARNLMLTLPNG